jgi:hypothetical protein
MKQDSARSVLWLHTLVMSSAGLLFFVLPEQGAALWPWTFPPLATRFMGALFLGGATCSFVFLRTRSSAGSFVLVLLAIGDLLIASSGLLGIREIGLTPATALFFAYFSLFAVLLVLTAQAMKEQEGAALTPVARALRWFFFIHLLVVLPVGVSMFFLPGWALPLWPWRMTPINVRLIGSFFFGAAFISFWALRQHHAESLRAVLAMYAVFATMATVASIMHFALFDPARLATWAFFALYCFVAIGSAVFLLRSSRSP